MGWNELSVPDEPEGTGWVTAPLLTTSEIAQVILCRYTAERPSRVDVVHGIELNTPPECLARMKGLHPDEDCLTIFVSARSLDAGISAEAFTLELRTSDPSSEPLHAGLLFEADLDDEIPLADE
jgi:hypothetical protein